MPESYVFKNNKLRCLLGRWRLPSEFSGNFHRHTIYKSRAWKNNFNTSYSWSFWWTSSRWLRIAKKVIFLPAMLFFWVIKWVECFIVAIAHLIQISAGITITLCFLPMNSIEACHSHMMIEETFFLWRIKIGKKISMPDIIIILMTN